MNELVRRSWRLNQRTKTTEMGEVSSNVINNLLNWSCTSPFEQSQPAELTLDLIAAATALRDEHQ